MSSGPKNMPPMDRLSMATVCPGELLVHLPLSVRELDRAVPRAGEEDEPHRRYPCLLHRPEVLPSLPGGDVRVPRTEHDQGGGLHRVHPQQGGLLDVDVRHLPGRASEA